MRLPKQIATTLLCTVKRLIQTLSRRSPFSTFIYFRLRAADLDLTAAATRARPSGVLGPVLMPPWLRQRPPLPRPLRWHGCPARVRAPQGLFRSLRSRARSSTARSLATLTASRFAALAALEARRKRTRSSCSARRAATKRSTQLSDFIPSPRDARGRARAYCVEIEIGHARAKVPACLIPIPSSCISAEPSVKISP
jgi:hypothetical protein